MKLGDYLTTRVQANLNASEHLSLAVGTFVATASSVFLVHQFLPGGHHLGALAIHCMVLGATFTVSVVFVTTVSLRLMRRANSRDVKLWQLWALSLLAYNVGYFLELPLDDWGGLELHSDTSTESPWFHYARLVPIWVIATTMFIQALTRRALNAELAELTQTARLDQSRSDSPPTGHNLHIVSGKKHIELDAERISHIQVEDHYCHIHHLDDTVGWRKTDVTLPLRDVLAQAPSSFLLIHRSYAVNPTHLERIEREGRSYRLILTNDVILPISRHRLREVLPLVKKSLRPPQ